MPRLPGRRPALLLELDLTSVPAESEADSVLSRLRSRGGHQLRPTLRALHEAADDRRVVGPDRQGRRHAAVGGDAGAAAGGPRLRDERQADPRLGGELRRGLRRHRRVRAGDRRSTRSGCSPAAGSACSASGSRRPSSAARSTSWASSRRSSSATSTRTPPTGSCGRSSPRPTASRSSGWPRRSSTTAVAAIAAGRRLDAERGPRAGRHRPAHRDRGAGRRPGRPARLSRPGLRGDPGPGGRRRRAVVRRPVESTPPAHDCPPGARATSRWSRSAGRSPPVVRGATAMGRQVGSDSVGAAAAGRRRPTTRSRAVVLRVDSPGGSAVASDTIWREVCRVREAGKPVVVSMGDGRRVGRLLHRLLRPT